MPSLTPDALPAGLLAGSAQPVFTLGDGATARPWRTADAPFLVEAFRVPDISRWYSRTMASEQEALIWIRRWLDRWTQATGAGWVIEAAGRPVGQVNLKDLSLAAGQARFSSWIIPEARRRGLRTAAARAVVDWAFNTVGLVRLETMHSTKNPAPCAATTKAGFGYEGTLRNKALYPDGWHDLHVHAVINEAVPRSAPEPVDGSATYAWGA